MGMAFITIQTIWTKTSLRASMARLKGAEVSLGKPTRTMPKNTAKKMICSMDMSARAWKMLVGTTSTSGWRGPLDLVRSALFSLSMTQSFIWTCSAVMSATFSASAGSLRRLMSSRMSMLLASRHSS